MHANYYGGSNTSIFHLGVSHWTVLTVFLCITKCVCMFGGYMPLFGL